MRNMYENRVQMGFSAQELEYLDEFIDRMLNVVELPQVGGFSRRQEIIRLALARGFKLFTANLESRNVPVFRKPVFTGRRTEKLTIQVGDDLIGLYQRFNTLMGTFLGVRIPRATVYYIALRDGMDSLNKYYGLDVNPEDYV